MDNEPTTFGLSHEKLAKLWKVGEDMLADEDGPAEDQKKAELLRDRLAELLPLDLAMTGVLSQALSFVLEQFRPLPGSSLRNLLFDPSVDPTVIRQIKERYKERAKSCSSELEREAATVIYYAAIANALTHHGVRITKLSYESLGRSFAELAKSNWLPPDMKQLFVEAHKGCSRHVEKSEE